MEADGEVSGEGNSYTTQFRQYDPRLGRWKSLDPLMVKYPSVSPFTGMGNNPISLTDVFGLEPEDKDKKGSTSSNPEEANSVDEEKEIIQKHAGSGSTDDIFIKNGDLLVKYTYDKGSGTWIGKSQDDKGNFTDPAGAIEGRVVDNTDITATSNQSSVDFNNQEKTQNNVQMSENKDPTRPLTEKEKQDIVEKGSDAVKDALGLLGMEAGGAQYFVFGDPSYTTDGGSQKSVTDLRNMSDEFKGKIKTKTQMGYEFVDDFDQKVHGNTSKAVQSKFNNGKWFKAASKSLGYAGAIYTVVDVLFIQENPSTSDYIEAGADVTVGIATMYMGPAGWAVGALYFLGKEFIKSDASDWDFIYKLD